MTTTIRTVSTGAARVQQAAQHPERPVTEPRRVRWVTWLAVLAPLPYSLSRLLWAAGIPFVISEATLRKFGAPGWVSLHLLLLALLSEGTGLFVHTFVLHRTRTVPNWIPVLRGRPVRPGLVIAPLLLPIAVLAFAAGQTADVLFLGDLPSGIEAGERRGIVMTTVIFWVWGVSLTVATFAYFRRTRSWRRESPCTANQPERSFS
jgi:hypothetical protein